MIDLIANRVLILNFTFLGLSREIAGLTNRADSENENQEVTPDTDTDSQEMLQKHQPMSQNMQTHPPPYQSQSSFKRAPVMGNRGLETRNSKRASQRKETVNSASSIPLAQPVVGALEVQNVKRAINRYGTLPKGARIGAYLESLRQNGDSTQPLPAAGQSPPQASTLPETQVPVNPGLSPRTGIKTQPQMIRSNSSSGVTMSNSATASLNKLQRHRTTTDGTMITTFTSFRGTNNQSPKRAMQPLADLEFPPPPSDLPPPPEEFEMTNSQYVMDIPQSKVMQTKDADVSNTEPSVEEASTRFGVSLRKREPSTDSCSSLGSPAADPNLAISVCPPPPPMAPPSAAVAANVIKEKLDLKDKKLTKSPGNSDVPKPTNHLDPATQLINELAEHKNLVKNDTTAKQLNKLPVKTDAPTSNGIPFKAQLKKVEPKRLTKEPQKEECNSIIDFKSRLRRVDPAQDSNSAESGDDKKGTTSDNENLNNKMKPNINNQSQPMTKKTEIKIDVVPSCVPPSPAGEKKDTGKNVTGNDALMSEDDKRKSTGSISSLKKMWEPKDKQPNINNNNNEQITQLSPKLAIKNNVGKLKEIENHEENHLNNNNVSATNQNHTNNNHVDNNVEHPSVAKKPAVPVKPSKFSTIYATPTIQQHQQKLIENNNHSNTSNNVAPTATTASSNNINTTTASSNPSSRESILDAVQILEFSLKTPVSLLTATQWLQLSEKLNHIQTSCVSYADTESMPPHTKFQFRELVTRVENQSNCLRTAGNKNVHDNEKLVVEVGQSLKQLSNALHR